MVQTEAEWLDGAATYLARITRMEAVSTAHLWLALLADVKSQWAALVDDYGGGTYEEWKKDWDKTSRQRGVENLPEVWTLPAHENRPPATGLSSLRQLVRGLVRGVEKIRAWFHDWTESAAFLEPVPLPWTRQAQLVWADATYQTRGVPTAGAILVALVCQPGSHQYMVGRNGPAIAAAARRKLGQPAAGDGLQLAFAWPARMGRRIKQSAKSNGQRPGASLLAKAPALGLAVLGNGAAVVRCLIFGATILFLYTLLAPAILLLNFIRATIGITTKTGWTYKSGLAYPGGEVSVNWTDTPPSRATLLLLLLPRGLLFLLGWLALAPGLARLQGVGQPIISSVAERPDLLRSIGAPLYIFADLLITNGVVRGLTIVAALGALFLSLPTHREIEQARLVLRSMDANAQAPSHFAKLLAGTSLVAKLADGADDLLAWTASPIYITTHLLPMVLGLLFAEFASRLVISF